MHEIPVNLSPGQLDLYKIIARDALDGGPGDALAAITRLLVLCAHPEALNGDGSGYVYSRGESPKLDQIVDLLHRIRNTGEKAVIFARFIALQRILQLTIAQIFGIRAFIINGQMTENRQMVVELFSSQPGFNVLILSHEVGGVGLNITAANHVIHFTRPWNPAKENQATDRVHRIGQRREVHVYFPIVKSPEFKTVEERLSELLESKYSLAHDVLRPSRELQIRREELLGSVTQDIFKPAGQDEKGRLREPMTTEVHERGTDTVTEPACTPKSIPGKEVKEKSRQVRDRFALDRPPVPISVDIGENQQGISYEKLFLPYLRGASSIELVDPYIRRPYQVKNFLEFVDLVKSLGRKINLKLITSVETYDEKEEIQPVFDGLVTGLESSGIHFEYHFRPNIHDRWIRTDEGWRILIGRGLDIFKPYQPRSAAESDQTKRRCKRTVIGYTSVVV